MSINKQHYSWQRSGLDPDGKPYEWCSPNLDQIMAYLRQEWGTTTLGCHVDRDIRGGSSPSTHAYGAAADERYPTREVFEKEILPFLIDNSAELGVSLIIDYVGSRIWKAGRTPKATGAHSSWWKPNTTASGMGQAWATYFHLEVTRDSWGWTTPVADRLDKKPADPAPDPDPITKPPITIPPIVSPSVPRPAIHRGVSGDEVYKLIEVMKANGWYPSQYLGDTNDGMIGSRGDQAIKTMQAALGADVDGYYGPVTAALLQAHLATGGRPCDWPQVVGTMNEGHSGIKTTMLQQQLAAHGWYPYRVDGKYGPMTRRGVQQLQREAKARGADVGPIDGLYGPRTAASACALLP